MCIRMTLWLKGVTCLPLSAIVEVTFLRLVECFKNTSPAANEAIGNPSLNFPQRVQDDMNSKMQKSKMHHVIRIDTNTGQKFQGKVVWAFKVQSKQKTEVVHLILEDTHSTNNFGKSSVRKNATCSCNKPQLLHKPCSHVIAVCCQTRGTYATSCTGAGRPSPGHFDRQGRRRRGRGAPSLKAGEGGGIARERRAPASLSLDRWSVNGVCACTLSSMHARKALFLTASSS
jgi:hypothetical protein